LKMLSLRWTPSGSTHRRLYTAQQSRTSTSSRRRLGRGGVDAFPAAHRRSARERFVGSTDGATLEDLAALSPGRHATRTADGLRGRGRACGSARRGVDNAASNEATCAGGSTIAPSTLIRRGTCTPTAMPLPRAPPLRGRPPCRNHGCEDASHAQVTGVALARHRRDK
jgi:hypothetical protein